jgi:hypothetical protein
VQLTVVVLVVTPTATTPPIELVTVYVRVALGAYAQVVAVASPLIATVGFCCAVKAVALVALAEAGHPACCQSDTEPCRPPSIGPLAGNRYFSW